MMYRLVGQGAARCALACLFVIGFMPSAEAAFTATINSTTVVDNGAGDLDSRTGFIDFRGTVDGYLVQLSSSTNNTSPTADLTTSQLRVVNVSATGALNVSLTDTFNQPAGYRGTQNMLNTLTRNIIGGLDSSGVVSSTTSGNDGTNHGSTSPVVLTNLPTDSGFSWGSFERVAENYDLLQSITIAGLLTRNGVTVTAASFSSSPENLPGNLNAVPAPPAFALLAGGLLTLGLARVRPSRLWRKK